MISFVTLTLSSIVGILAFIVSLPFTGGLTILGVLTALGIGALLIGAVIIGAPFVLLMGGGALLAGGGAIAAIVSVILYLIFGDGAIPGGIIEALQALTN